MARKTPKTAQFLVHQVDLIKIPVDGRSRQDIINDIAANGMSMGMTSLRRLLGQEVSVSCGFELMNLPVEEPTKPISAGKMDKIMDVLSDVKKELDEVSEPEPEAKVDEVVESKDEVKAEPADVKELEEIPAPAPALSIMSAFNQDVLNVANSVLAAVSNAQTVLSGKKPEEKVDGQKTQVKAMRRGTKNEAVFRMLCNGATVKEIANALKWTEGAVSSVVFWEPNNKGYGLDKEKVDGRGTVNFLTIDGKRIGESELVFNK